jgi:uncharacterized repeat protein (TIGR01451 family)
LSSDLAITKTGPSSVYYLNSISYTIVVTNNGPSDVVGATVADTLPSGLTGATWTCTASLPSVCTPTSGTGNVSAIVSLVSGGTATISVSATVSASTASSITNTATVTAPVGVADAPGNNSASVTTSVNKRLVQLTYTGASNGQYSDPVGASATLRDVTGGAPGTPIPGKTITFSLGGQTFTAVTDATGLAQTTTTAVADRLNQPFAALPKTMGTAFGPDPIYATASDSDSYTVNKEDAVVSMIEPSIIQTDGTDSDVDSLKLTLTIDEAPDGYLSGALPNAPSGQTGLKNAYPIPTSLVRISNGTTFGSCTPALTSYTVVDADTDTAFCSIANVPMDTYEIDATIGGDYFVGGGQGAIVVYDPSLGFITGGGWYTTDQGRLNFGFNAKYLKSGQIQGSLLTILHRPEGNYMLKSNSMGTLTVTKDSTNTFWTAVLKGKATYQVPSSQPALSCGLNKCGGYTWTMYVEDRQEPGSGYDKFWLEVRDGNNNIVSLMSLPQTPALYAKVIDHGNIQVPQPQSAGK